MSVLNYILTGTPYELSSEAKENLKSAIFAYPKFSADFEIPRGLTGRFPNTTVVAITPFAMLYAADPQNNLDAGKYYKRTTISSDNTANMGNFMLNQISQNIQNSVTPDFPITEGHFSFLYGGISIHKYNGYQVSVKGLSKSIWNYENSANENLFGRYNSSGYMEILTVGTPKTRLANGLGVAGTNGSVTDNGWDWVHLPGTTGAEMPLTNLQTGTMRLFNGKNFLVHASLDNNGIFAMDYKDPSSPTSMSAYKSVFFFKDKLICLGSDIKDVGGSFPIHTTLFQTGISDPTLPNYIDGNTHSGLSTNFSATSGAHWATDAIGNGFVIPDGGLNGTLVIKRSSQQSRNHSNTTDTQGNYVTAYINHGVAPASGSYRYGILLQGGNNETQNFANNFSSIFNILRQDQMAHAVKFESEEIFGYSVLIQA